jgi:hypothetical protein
MRRRDRYPPPDNDETAEIRAHIWAPTPCQCTPTIRVHPRTGRVRAGHDPTCPAGTLGHQRIDLDDPT